MVIKGLFTVFDMPEKVTIWSNLGNDGFGGVNWGAPVTVDARVAFVQERFTDINGNDAISKSVFYTYGDFKLGDAAYLGASAEITPPPASDDVRAVSQTPSGAGELKKAWL